MWFGEFDPEDKGLYQRVCLWLTDRWDMVQMFRYNWRSHVELWWVEHRVRQAKRKLRKKYPDLKI